MALSVDTVVCEIARKSHVAEQRTGGEIVVPFQTVDFKSDLHAVAALEPAQMILELLAVVAEAGIRKISLRDGLQSDAAPIDLQQPADVRQIGSKAHQAELVHDIQAIDRDGHRVV